ncbi:MAG: DUF362 domain-containing protein [Deltaproteobacteria bacterium]|nr:DUF362 domain-containing protein [Deltaproteobacteria bacterium]
MSKIFVSLTKEREFTPIMEQALQWINWESIVSPGARVFIKPNFTFPFYKPGVTTSPEIIETLVRILRERTSRIVIGESDGGARSWKAEDAFQGHDLPRIAGKYNISLVNLSVTSREWVELPMQKKKVRIELPSLLLHETDVFITIPVPKIHCMTKVSLALKNQWGCIPGAENRFRWHSRFDEMICILNGLFRPRLIIGDCTWMLTGNGPMFGEPLKRDMLVVSDHIGAFELTMLHLMGLEKWRISHLEEAKRRGMVPTSLSQIAFNTDWRPFRSDQFFLKRTLQNWIALAGFKNRFVTWLGYESPFARPIHDILYYLKGNPLKEALLQRQSSKRSKEP